MAASLEDVGKVSGGDTLRSFLGVSFNDDASLKGVASGALSGPTPSGDTTGATDTPLLQAALNAAAGGVLALGTGTYYLNATLTYNSSLPVAIVGRGMEQSNGITKIKAAVGGQFVGTQVGTTGWFPLISIANTSNVNHFRLENFYVDMTGYTNTIGVYCDQVGYSRFDNLKFREGAIGLAGLRLAGSVFYNLHAWNQAVYGFAFLGTDGAGGTGAGTVSVTTNGQSNSLTDCEYRMTTSTNNCTAGYAVLSGQQDINFTNCHSERLAGVTSGVQYGFFVKGPVSTWPPDATWAGECHMVQCNADGITDQASGTGAGFWFENYRHIRLDQTWDSAMDVGVGWYSPACVVKQCQDVVIRACEISANGLQLQGNVDLLTVANNHFLNAGTTTTAISIGSATLTNLILTGNNKKVVAALWFDNQALADAALNSPTQDDRAVSGIETRTAQRLSLPTGAKGANADRIAARLDNVAGGTSGTLKVSGARLLGNEAITSCNFVTNATPATGPTHSWAVLLDGSLNVVRQSTDQLAAAINANTSINYILDSIPVTAGSRSGGTLVTLTIPTLKESLTSLVAVNDSITVNNASIAAYNGTFSVVGVTSTTITYNAGSSATDSLAGPFPTVQLAAGKRVFTPPSPALYFFGWLVAVSTTMPTYTGITLQTAVTGIAPIVDGTSSAGLTGTCSSPSGVVSASGGTPYVYWS